MKISIEIDCTPEEARRFLGLPDLTAAQAEIVETLRRETVARMTDLDPQSLVQAWMPGGGEAWDKLQKTFWSRMSAAAASGKAQTDEGKE
ncbi:MAG: hypothetical protein HOK81_08300 [Rhodospirillaceae bacterium]|mgnify:CR=1 FL=1|nr:hypothetical protein [Rhodospirillaceae bacterium]